MINTLLRQRMALGTLAVCYAARPITCGVVLGRFSELDDVAYANFDRHGVSNSFGLVGAVVCAFPLWWLARRLLMSPNAAAGSGPACASAAGAAVVAVAIALPSFVQIDYIVHLPLAIMWPVIASACLWAASTAVVWLGCVRTAEGRRRIAEVRYQAAGIAVLVTTPKLMLLTI